MSTAIGEFHTSDHALGHADLIGRDQPLATRGLRDGWPVFPAARESDTAFTTRLVGYDHDADVDTLPMAALVRSDSWLVQQARTYAERANIQRSKYLLNL